MKPRRLMCARSTITPQRSHSRTTSRPKPVSPVERIRAAALRRAADRVLREVQQAEVAHAAPRERLDRLELALERLAALDPAERRDLAGRLRGANVGAGARPRAAARDASASRRRARRADRRPRACSRARAPASVQKLKNWPATPPSRMPRQIDVAEHVRDRRHRALVARREVVAELVHQLRGVGVEIDHADLGVERAGLVERQRHRSYCACFALEGTAASVRRLRNSIATRGNDQRGSTARCRTTVRPGLGSTTRPIQDAFAENGGAQPAADRVGDDARRWRLAELQRAGTAFLVSEDDCNHAGNRDVGRDRVIVTWRDVVAARRSRITSTFATARTSASAASDRARPRAPRARRRRD